MWLDESLLPRLLDDSALLRDTGSVLLGTVRLRQVRHTEGEMETRSQPPPCFFPDSLVRGKYLNRQGSLDLTAHLA